MRIALQAVVLSALLTGGPRTQSRPDRLRPADLESIFNIARSTLNSTRFMYPNAAIAMQALVQWGFEELDEQRIRRVVPGMSSSELEFWLGPADRSAGPPLPADAEFPNWFNRPRSRSPHPVLARELLFFREYRDSVFVFLDASNRVALVKRQTRLRLAGDGLNDLP
jgi:hypothetical protein